MATSIEEGGSAHIRYGGEKVTVKILAVAGDTVAVDFPDRARKLKVGGGVDLELADSHGVASFHMQVIVDAGQLGDGMILQRTSSVTPRQRRKSWRVPVGVKTRVRRPGSSDVSVATIVNISAEGALIEVDENFDPMDMVEMELKLPSHKTRVALARVIRVEVPVSQGVSPGCYGTVFYELSKEAKRSLTEFISQRLLETRSQDVASLFPGSSGRSKMQRRRETDKQD